MPIALRFALLFAFSAIILALNSPVVLTAACASIFIASLLLGKHAVLMERVRPLVVISLFVVVFQFFAATFLPWQERLVRGILAGEKILSLSLAVFLLTETTSPAAMVRVFSFLPYRLRLLMTITFSLLPAIMREGKIISAAQRSRGFRPSWRRPLFSLLPIVLPLLNSTLARAERIAMAMLARGYRET